MDKLRACLQETPSQTAGPYVHIGLIPRHAGFDIFQSNFSNLLAAGGIEGERILIEGRVLDGIGAPARDVLLEVWQANAAGFYNHPAHSRADTPIDKHFRGWGRTGTDFETGIYSFETIKPGRVPGRYGDCRMAPHVNFWLVARGINVGLHTRMYFADEAEANNEDPVLKVIEPPERRRSLMAERTEREGKVVYRFDIHLQGTGETVFFDI